MSVALFRMSGLLYCVILANELVYPYLFNSLTSVYGNQKHFFLAAYPGIIRLLRADTDSNCGADRGGVF